MKYIINLSIICSVMITFSIISKSENAVGVQNVNVKNNISEGASKKKTKKTDNEQAYNDICKAQENSANNELIKMQNQFKDKYGIEMKFDSVIKDKLAVAASQVAGKNNIPSNNKQSYIRALVAVAFVGVAVFVSKMVYDFVKKKAGLSNKDLQEINAKKAIEDFFFNDVIDQNPLLWSSLPLDKIKIMEKAGIMISNETGEKPEEEVYIKAFKDIHKNFIDLNHAVNSLSGSGQKKVIATIEDNLKKYNVIKANGSWNIMFSEEKINAAKELDTLNLRVADSDKKAEKRGVFKKIQDAVYKGFAMGVDSAKNIVDKFVSIGEKIIPQHLTNKSKKEIKAQKDIEKFFAEDAKLIIKENFLFDDKREELHPDKIKIMKNADINILDEKAHKKTEGQNYLGAFKSIKQNFSDLRNADNFLSGSYQNEAKAKAKDNLKQFNVIQADGNWNKAFLKENHIK